MTMVIIGRSRGAPPGIGLRPRYPPLEDNRQSRFCRIWRNLWHPGGIPCTMQEFPPQIPAPIP